MGRFKRGRELYLKINVDTKTDKQYHGQNWLNVMDEWQASDTETK